MRKFLLLLFLLFVQIPIWGQDVVSTREALADTITGRLFEYVEDGAEKMVDGEFSILRIPANVWHYFKSKEKRQAIFEQRLSKYITIDSVAAIVNQEIGAYNKSHPSSQIEPIAIEQVKGLLSDDAAQAIQDRASIEVLDIASEIAIGVIAWLAVVLAMRFFIAPWLSAKIEDVNMQEAFWGAVIEKKTGGRGFLNSLGQATASAIAGVSRQRAVEKAVRRKKTIRRCVSWPLTIAFFVWQVVEAPKREAKAKAEIQKGYIEVLSKSNVMSHILHE